MFPPEYPFKPPGIKMLTPSGRFQPDKKICFSMSDYHPGTWNPAWSVATICTGLLSFMMSDEMTTGSMTSTDADKRVLAQRSHDWNRKQRRFIEAFPEYAGEVMKDLPNMGEKDRGVPSASAKPTTPAVQAPIPPIARNPAPIAAVVRPTQVDKPAAIVKPMKSPPAATQGWISGWTKALMDRWHYVALFAVAVIVSRLSG
ncbi:Ubiquitin-conjugating enzyme E2 6 [Tulasnella sp. 418]|nr:Ubiquitin-conjugating enzyme E2 6 [Tulasnella sp. 418]